MKNKVTVVSKPGLMLTIVAWLAAASNSAAGAITQQAYIKASNTGAGDGFGMAVAVSGDTMVVGAGYESSGGTGVGADPNDNSALSAGAAYIYVRQGGTWVQQAYLKPSNSGAGDWFGFSVAISGDIVVIGAPYEDSNATTINGNGGNNSLLDSGAAYVFVRNGSNWTQQAYLKASNVGGQDYFGSRVAVSGNTVVVGAPSEDSYFQPSDNQSPESGAAYIFVRDGDTWSQQAILKSPTMVTSRPYYFGSTVAISGDTVIISSPQDPSSATGVNGNNYDIRAPGSGAAFVFVRNGTQWSREAYLKASNTDINDSFGSSVAISGDTAVVGSFVEASSARGIDGIQSDNSARESGAAYIFERRGSNWSQRAYLKASNSAARNYFGRSVAISGDTVVVGATVESSTSVGVNGDQTNIGLTGQGAAYVFIRRGQQWRQEAYLKASNAGSNDSFGASVAVSEDLVVVTAPSEDSSAYGVNGDQSDDLIRGVDSGAAYAFSGFCSGCPVLKLIGDGSGGYTLVVEGKPNAVYRLERSEAPDGPWDALDTLTAPAAGKLEYHDPASSNRHSFYRAILAVAP